jgi:DNA-binding NarL/FixJ family response regulator
MSYKILVVDDSKLARMAVAKAIHSLRPDWKLVEASRADEAMLLAGQSHFDIALIDFNMPERDGLRLASDLRERNPGMAMALISANLQREITERAHAVRARFLPKPVSEAAMGEFLDQAEAQLKATRT